MVIINVCIMLQVLIICILDAHKMDTLANCGCPDLDAAIMDNLLHLIRVYNDC